MNELTNSIPKVIHYCWLSDDEKPDFIKKCMQTWKKAMPDYEIICWDRNRFPVNDHPFVKAAYEARKWAFAADVIRLYALYHYGGIYLDSDVAVYQPFDIFLHHSVFSSIEFYPELYVRSVRKGNYQCGLGIEAAVMGAVPKHPWIKTCLDHYENLQFINNSKFMKRNVMGGVLAKMAVPIGFKYHPIYQHLESDVHIYPPDVFALINKSSLIKYSMHNCVNSWNMYETNKLEKFKKFIIEKIIGRENWIKIRKRKIN